MEGIENLCNHALLFDIDAGVKDILKVSFDKAPEGTIVNYAYGASFDSAEGGGVIEKVKGQEITIVFPNNLYFSIEHVTDPPGDFEFSFSYTGKKAKDDGPNSIFELEAQQI